MGPLVEKRYISKATPKTDRLHPVDVSHLTPSEESATMEADFGAVPGLQSPIATTEADQQTRKRPLCAHQLHAISLE